MQLKNEAPTGLIAEIKIVPPWAWMLAAFGLIGLQIIFSLASSGPDALPAWARALLGMVAGTVLGCYLLLVGYITRDARRRAMSPPLWTLVAVLIPNGLGIILYFILRQPLRKTCPQCGNAVQTAFNFCPHCNSKLGPSCPRCQHVVGSTDAYCPYCGTSLRTATVSDDAPRPDQG